MAVILKLDHAFAGLARLCGSLACIAMILLLFNVFYDVVMRYAFNDVSIGMQELEWHLFSAVFLLGIPYAIRENSHVRVDILYDNWTPKTQALINLFGAIFFVLPFVILVTYFSIKFSFDAYQMGEGSGDPGGLPHRWLIKGLIPFSFIMLGLVSLGIITSSILSLKQIPFEPSPKQKPKPSNLL
ncbi:MAG: TRAP-type mannitol/chloroaromatic compound transport system permease small subunit [Oleiphilaceae bacterium]|jgi:TRAP-type mannitol/chloroaromatic compound transport system permease small subunit